MSERFNGDVELIASAVREAIPDVVVYQLQVKHPADDNGIWYFYLPTNPGDDIQIESSSGKLPFIIENSRDNSVQTGETLSQVVAVIVTYLKP